MGVSRSDQWESPETANGKPPSIYRDYSREYFRDYQRLRARGDAPAKKLDVKTFPEEASENGSVKAVNPDRIDSLKPQQQGQGKFSATPPNQSTEDSSHRDGFILPKEQQRDFWRALTAYVEKTNPKMSRGRAESIASASTERLLNQVPKTQDQEYLDMYRQGILPCYTDNRINYQTIKEHQTLEELRGMLYDD